MLYMEINILIYSLSVSRKKGSCNEINIYIKFLDGYKIIFYVFYYTQNEIWFISILSNK